MDLAPKVIVNSISLNRAIGAMLTNSKRKLEAVMNDQAKLFVKAMIENTPPGGKDKTLGQARKSGEKRVASDLHSIMTGVRARRSVTSDDIEGIHKGQRFQGTVRPIPLESRQRVPAVALKAYIKKAQKQVGILASGWAAAASKYGYKPPAWITRHAAQGTGDVFFVQGSLIRLRLTNPVSYASRYGWIVSGALSSRIRAIWRREAKFRGKKAIESAGRESGVGK